MRAQLAAVLVWSAAWCQGVCPCYSVRTSAYAWHEGTGGSGGIDTANSQDSLGCHKGVKRNADIDSHGGQHALEDYLMIANEQTTMLYSAGEGLTVDGQERPRCPDTVWTSGETHPLEKVVPGILSGGRAGELGTETHEYLDEHLTGLDRNQPVILSSVEVNEMNYFNDTQHANFFCGLARLGLLKRAVVIAMDAHSAEVVRQIAPGAVLLHHRGVLEAISRVSELTNINYSNRIAKLVGAALLLERGYSVVVSDTDMYWVEDPIDGLVSVGTDLVAMKDICPLTLNSGFLYYKATDAVRGVLRMSLGLKKWVGPDGEYLPSDNDQYLLNCAVIATAASGGIRPHLLSQVSFVFGPDLLNRPCAESSTLPRLVVWHKAKGLTDLDSSSNKCIEHPRTQTEVDHAAAMCL